MAAITICTDFGDRKNKVSHCFHCFLIYLPRSDGNRCHDLGFLNVELEPAFSLSSFSFIKRLLCLLMAESEEELKSLLIKVKEESERVVLKFNIQKTKIMASDPITSWLIDGGTVETAADFILAEAGEGLQNHYRW